MKQPNILPDNFFKMSPEDRRTYLKSNADETIRDEVVFKPLDGEHREQAKEQLVQLSVELSKLEDQYDEVKSEWKEKLDPIKKEKKQVLKTVKMGYEETKEDVYLIRDYDTGRVYSLTTDGTIVNERRMFDSEKQATIQGNIRSINSNS